jgi:hypothetical protein
VRFVAASLDLVRPTIDPGKSDDERAAWLVERHRAPVSAAIPAAALGVGERWKARAHDAPIGAASVPFAVAPEARRLGGLDPADARGIEDPADFVARWVLPWRARAPRYSGQVQEMVR